MRDRAYARTRPGTVLADDVHLGNFVEVKNSRIESLKANPPRLRGRCRRRSRWNIGAGTITCNYDGANKFRTTIEDDVFIGSDTQLVAPVTVGRGATLGAGTTLRRTRRRPAHGVARKADHDSGLETPGQAQARRSLNRRELSWNRITEIRGFTCVASLPQSQPAISCRFFSRAAQARIPWL